MEQLTRSFTLLLKQRYRVVLVALLIATGLVFAGFSHAPAAHAATAALSVCPNDDSGCPSRHPVDQNAICDMNQAYLEGYTCHGCKPGYVCIYPADGWNNDHPSLTYYYYGVYQLSNQYGKHRIINNQVDKAALDLCTDWNCTNRAMEFAPNTWGTWDLTPINSIKVKPIV